MPHGNDRVAEIKVNKTLKLTTLITLSANTKETVFLRVHTSKANLKQPFPCFTDRLSSFPLFLRITLAFGGTFSKRRAPEGRQQAPPAAEIHGKAAGLRAHNEGLCSPWTELCPRPHNGAL